MMGDRLTIEFFERDVLVVAPELVGKVLQVTSNKEQVTRRGIITEVEAYRGEEDGACHARFGRTRRTEVMYERGGLIYVYLIYGRYWMLNIVTGELDQPQAVLVRGMQIDQCSKIKKQNDDLQIINEEILKPSNAAGRQVWDDVSGGERISGPGRVGRWLGLEGSLYGEDVTSSQRIWLEDSGIKIQDSRVVQTPRIGVNYAGEWAKKEWRWVVN